MIEAAIYTEIHDFFNHVVCIEYSNINGEHSFYFIQIKL